MNKRVIAISLIIVLSLLCIALLVAYYELGPDLRCYLPEGRLADTGWSVRNFTSGERERCYSLYIPPDIDPNQPSPLVVSFHGFLFNPNSHALISQWHKLARDAGFLVAYPQGTSYPLRWNAGEPWGIADLNDVQFFLDLLDDIAEIAVIDSTRVYVNGFSNGGGLSVRLACDVADKIAAIGSVAGAIVDLNDCNPSHPVPVMAFHGTADPVVDYYGRGMRSSLLRRGAGFTNAPTEFLGAEDWTSRWAEYNGCDPVAEAIDTWGDVIGVHYTACDDDAEVYLYTIEGGGHTWPGGWPIPFLGETSGAINATKELWGFYQNYQLETPQQ